MECSKFQTGSNKSPIPQVPIKFNHVGELINASHLSPIKATYSQKYTSWETKTIIPTGGKINLINLAIESQTSKLIPCNAFTYL